MAKRQPLYPHVPKSVERLPQTSPDGDSQKGMYLNLNLTRQQATETIISNLIQAGVLLRSEAVRYRGVLKTYDNINLLKVLFYSQILMAE